MAGNNTDAFANNGGPSIVGAADCGRFTLDDFMLLIDESDEDDEDESKHNADQPPAADMPLLSTEDDGIQPAKPETRAAQAQTEHTIPSEPLSTLKKLSTSVRDHL